MQAHKTIVPLSPGYIKEAIERRTPSFQGSNQHDCHDLMDALLNGIHEDLNRAKDEKHWEQACGDGNNDSFIATAAWTQYKLRHDSIVVDTFQGQTRSSLTCPNCHLMSVKFDSYMYLSIPIKNCDNTDLKTCLQAYTGVEQLTEANAWYCTSCKKNVLATKQMQLWKSSDILVVQLKRFSFSTQRSPHRVDTLVNVSLDEVDFSPYFALDSPSKNTENIGCTRFQITMEP